MQNVKHLAIVIFIFTFASVSGQTNNVINNIRNSQHQISPKQANLIFEKAKVFPNDTEIAIAFIKDGQVSYFGIKLTNDTLQYSNNSRDIFEIGSITKVFTSTLLANFVLENKIDLNYPVQKYFNYPIANAKITVLQLANHTSGMPKLPSNLDLETADKLNPYKDYSEDKLKEYLTEKLEIHNTPGSTYEYSNIGAGILGYLLEVQSHTTYEELLQKYISSKYNMNNTTTDKNKIKLKLINGLDSNGNKTSNWDLNALVGAGGILSNVEDLSKIAMAQFNDKNKELLLTRQTTFGFSDEMEVGLAWKIIQPYSELKRQWYAHNGGTGGYSSLIALDIEKRSGIIVLSNVSTFNNNTNNIDQLCFELMKTQYEK